MVQEFLPSLKPFAEVSDKQLIEAEDLEACDLSFEYKLCTDLLQILLFSFVLGRIHKFWH
jgi:hypothetical protein